MSHNFVKEADYIVVGAGSAGCIIASRLAQAGESVIVIEAGPDTSLESTDPLFQIDKLNVFVPLLFPALWRRFQRVPESDQCGFWHATQTLLPFVSTNQNGIYYPVRCFATYNLKNANVFKGASLLWCRRLCISSCYARWNRFFAGV